MGMEVIAPGKIVVSQMAELTLIEDLDGDGVADRYRNLCSILGLVEIIMKPMPSAQMGMVGSILHWVQLPTMDLPFTHPGANISMTEEEAEISLP